MVPTPLNGFHFRSGSFIFQTMAAAFGHEFLETTPLPLDASGVVGAERALRLAFDRCIFR